MSGSGQEEPSLTAPGDIYAAGLGSQAAWTSSGDSFFFFLNKYLLIDFREGRERNIDLLFYFLMHSLVDSFFLRLYFFTLRERARKGERDRNISVWLPLTCPPPRTQPAAQACSLTGNRIRDPLVCRPALNPLSHSSQGHWLILYVP